MIARAVSARLDAVTIDAYGTLVTLLDPLPPLQDALRRHGVERDLSQVARGFSAEMDYYVERSHEGRDEATLALLRHDCASIFLRGAGAEIDPGAFVNAFIDSLRFAAADGVGSLAWLATGRGAPVGWYASASSAPPATPSASAAESRRRTPCTTGTRSRTRSSSSRSSR